jgi:uncharacterized membrane protein YadS
MTLDWSSLYKKDDWWALWIGLLLFVLSFPAYYGTFLLGWAPKAVSWTTIDGALAAKSLNPWLGLGAMYVFLLAILTPVALKTGATLKAWVQGFTFIFVVCWVIWIFSNYAPLVKTMGSAEVGFVFALVVGLIVGNLPRVPSWLSTSAKSEFFIKTAIVLLGAKILFTTFATSGPAVLAAVFLSFPVVWVVSFAISRRFGLHRDLAATMSSGVGVCGISAAIATSSAIDADPVYPTMVSSIIVVFSAIELLLLPFIGAFVFAGHPTAAGAWMGLSVKTDGAASASGSVVDGLLGGTGAALNMAVLVKVMIDIWIGVIAFVLASVWAFRFKKKEDARASPVIIWHKFPKFILGYVLVSAILSAVAFTYPSVSAGASAVAPVANSGTEAFRVVFFVFTFLAIGLNTRISKFREVGLGKPVASYFISLMIAITWGGLISYLLFY